MIEKLPEDIQAINRYLDRFQLAAGDIQKDWGHMKDKALRVYVIILVIAEGILAWLDEKA